MKTAKALASIIVALCVFAGQASYAANKTLLVAGAVSLSAPVKEMGANFAKAEPGVSLEYSFAASGVILRQMKAGARVDVCIFADEETIRAAIKEALVDEATVEVIAANEVVVAYSKELKAAKSYEELLAANAVGRYALPNPDFVPLGRYVKEAMTAEGYEALRKSSIAANSAKDSVMYLERGEVDAAFAYLTDAAKLNPSEFGYLPLPGAQTAKYYAAVCKDSADPALALKFAQHLTANESARIFTRYGFSLPGGAAK